MIKLVKGHWSDEESELRDLPKVIQTHKQPNYNLKPVAPESKVYPLSKTRCLQYAHYYRYWSRLLSDDQMMYVLLLHALNLSLYMWWFNFLFQKVLMQPFIKWLVWIAATKKHIIPHPISGDIFFLVLNVSHSSLRAKFSEMNSFYSSQEWTFSVCIFSQFSIQRDFEISW